MDANRELIINEILEHTIDCDYNRSLHFIEYERYNRISRFLNLLQIVSLLVLVVFCSVIIPEIELKSSLLEYIIPIILSVIATTAELIDYFCNFSDLSQQHWLAAQAYARLYRQCQFFPSHYGMNCDESIMREAAVNICNELFDLNLMSPDLSEKNYIKVTKKLANKKYPIESVFHFERTEYLKEITNKIKDKLSGYKIEIISFGSFPNKKDNNDIDIAVVVHSKNIDEDLLLEKIIKLEQEFRNENQIIDLTLLTESRLQMPSQIPFIANIKKGELLYSSFGVHSSIFDYDLDTIHFKEILNTYFSKVESAYAESDSNNYINKAFYYIKNVISYILLNRNVLWSSEIEMISCFEKILSEELHFPTIMDLYLLLKKYKDNESSTGIDDNLSENGKRNIFELICEINQLTFVE
jgi:hypothetical protein